MSAARSGVGNGEVLAPMVLRLQDMRDGLERFRSGDRAGWEDADERWSMLLDRYDAALIETADVLGVPAPSAPPATGPAPRRLSDEDRTRLERLVCGPG